jgi:ribosomal protein L16 Arg81 hydroxylase
MQDVYDTLNKHMEENKACHLSKVIRPLPWEIVVKHLQECADEKYAGTPNGILSYQLNEAEEIPEVKVAIDEFNDNLDLKIFDAHIFTSFTTTRKNSSKHIDDHNVLLWSLTGNMKVNLYPTMNDGEEPFYSEVFEKGDLVFIPADMPHEIEPTGARALVSFGIEVEPGKNYKREVTNPYIKRETKDGTEQKEGE